LLKAAEVQERDGENETLRYGEWQLFRILAQYLLYLGIFCQAFFQKNSIKRGATLHKKLKRFQLFLRIPRGRDWSKSGQERFYAAGEAP
jgi:hypothetical protein